MSNELPVAATWFGTEDVGEGVTKLTEPSHTDLDHTGGAHEFAHVAVHGLEAGAVASPPPASLHPGTEMELLALVASRARRVVRCRAAPGARLGYLRLRAGS